MTRGRISRPVPPRRIFKWVYDFDTIEVGGYMFIKGRTDKAEQAREALADYAERTGRKFTAQRMDDGLHIWRIESDRKHEPSELEKTLMQSIQRYEARGDRTSAGIIRRRLAKLTAGELRTVWRATSTQP